MYDIGLLKKKTVAVYPYFGSIAASLECVEECSSEGFTREGNTITYDPQYMAGLSENDQLFLMAHELCHIAFEHDRRGKGRDRLIWDDATDAVINQMLKRDGFELMEGCIDYPEATGYDAEQYYSILLEAKLEIELTAGSMEGQKGSAAQRAGDFQNKEEDDNRELSEEELADMELLTEDMEFPSTDDGREASEESVSDGKEDEEEYALVEKKEAEAGNSVNRDKREVGEPGIAPPDADWRMLLNDSVNHEVDWSYEKAVIEDGVVRPVLQEISVPDAEIVLDTSWSVDEELLRRFLRECKNILRFQRIRAGCFDTVFYGFHDIRTEKDIDDMVFEGGGGTDFNVAAAAFSPRADNRVVFTDGQAPDPEKYVPAIWVVYGDEEIHPPGGIVIHIDPDKL